MKEYYSNDDRRYYDLRKTDKIVLRFLGGDRRSSGEEDKIPLRAVIQVGSVDPSTGRVVTKKDVTEYLTIHNQQAERNKEPQRNKLIDTT